MLHGHKGLYIGNIYGNERLGIPSINMHDGPQGFRVTATTGPEGSTTAWPSALSSAASWDTQLIYKWSAAMAYEFKMKGANVQLAPGIGIARVPTAGRNFEYLCGEDPYLGVILVKPAVEGIQSQGIIANAKHWVNNEIEDHRVLVSANVDERTRFELYYPPFDAAVRAGVHSVMCSYNRVNDVHACENPDTLSHLRDTMGFKGWVLSDWTATHSTVESLNAGMNQEMPLGIYYREDAVLAALDAGEVSMDVIDDSVLRILTAMFDIGLFDHPPTGDRNAVVTSDEHNALAREVAAKSTVLLKNDAVDGTPLLPLNPQGMSCIAVIGDNETVSGKGSGRVVPAYTVTPAQGVANALQTMGYEDVKVEYSDGKDPAVVESLAKSCDAVIVNVATSSGEGNDRETLALDGDQDDLVKTVVALNSHTIVSVVTPGAVLMPWAVEVPSLLISWLPGQEAGNALADVLFGVVNPSARLHVTMPNKDNEVGFSRSQYPGVGFPPEATYSEELLIGYRYYEATGIVPKFCFGHGLSYTSFEYSDLKQITSNTQSMSLDDVVASFEVSVTNNGVTDGSEVVQLYVTFPESTMEPPKMLRTFKKLAIGASLTNRVDLELTKRELSIWNSNIHAWEMIPGKYTVHVGASSCDIRQVIEFDVEA